MKKNEFMNRRYRFDLRMVFELLVLFSLPMIISFSVCAKEDDENSPKSLPFEKPIPKEIDDQKIVRDNDLPSDKGDAGKAIDKRTKAKPVSKERMHNTLEEHCDSDNMCTYVYIDGLSHMIVRMEKELDEPVVNAMVNAEKKRDEILKSERAFDFLEEKISDEPIRYVIHHKTIGGSDGQKFVYDFDKDGTFSITAGESREPVEKSIMKTDVLMQPNLPVVKDYYVKDFSMKVKDSQVDMYITYAFDDSEYYKLMLKHTIKDNAEPKDESFLYELRTSAKKGQFMLTPFRLLPLLKSKPNDVQKFSLRSIFDGKLPEGASIKNVKFVLHGGEKVLEKLLSISHTKDDIFITKGKYFDMMNFFKTSAIAYIIVDWESDLGFQKKTSLRIKHNNGTIHVPFSIHKGASYLIRAFEKPPYRMRYLTDSAGILDCDKSVSVFWERNDS